MTFTEKMTLIKDQSTPIKFSKLEIGSQFIGVNGGVVLTKIRKGFAAFPNESTNKVFVDPYTWNQSVILITAQQAMSLNK